MAQRFSPPSFQPGLLSRADADALSMLARELARLAGGFSASPPLSVQDGSAGVNYLLDAQSLAAGSLAGQTIDLTGSTLTQSSTQINDTGDVTENVSTGVTVLIVGAGTANVTFQTIKLNLTTVTAVWSVEFVDNSSFTIDSGKTFTWVGPGAITFDSTLLQVVFNTFAEFCGSWAWCGGIGTAWTTDRDDLVMPVKKPVNDIPVNAPVNWNGLVRDFPFQKVTFRNTGTSSAILKHNAGSSSADNRFATPNGGDYCWPPEAVVELWHDDTASPGRWVVQGGTVTPATTKGDIVVFDGSKMVRQAAGADGLPLVANSGASDGVNYAALGVAGGGTGAVTLAANGVVLGQGTSAVHVTGAGTAGQVLTSNGAGVDPTFQPAGAASLTSDQATLGAPYTLTNAYANVGLSRTLAAVGTYLVTLTIQGNLNSNLAGDYVSARLHDGTAAVTGSTFDFVTAAPASVLIRGSTTITVRVVTAAINVVINAQAQYTATGVIAVGTVPNATLSYVRVS